MPRNSPAYIFCIAWLSLGNPLSLRQRALKWRFPGLFARLQAARIRAGLRVFLKGIPKIDFLLVDLYLFLGMLSSVGSPFAPRCRVLIRAKEPSKQIQE
jgi:hypothetical protein